MTRAKAKAAERAKERAGYLHVSGWLPSNIAIAVLAVIRHFRPEVDAIDKGEKDEQ